MKTLLTSLLAVLLAFSASAQEERQKIIFDVTSTDTKVHKSTLLMMKVMSANYPNTLLEVVVYGEALPMLMKNQSTVANDIALYLDNDNVITGSYVLSHGVSGSNVFTDFTETTHYTLDKESGRIELTAGGVTAAGTDIIYSTYTYCFVSDAIVTDFISSAKRPKLLFFYLPIIAIITIVLFLTP